jgi:hypothetical protein
MIFNKCGDDKVTFCGKQSVMRVDPCLKLYIEYLIMVSTNDKKGEIVKGTTGIFKGVVLNADKCLKEELWNDNNLCTSDANDVNYSYVVHRRLSFWSNSQVNNNNNNNNITCMICHA